MTINRNLSLLTPNVSASGAVNNAGLTNSSVTIGSTAVSLGATVTTIAGLVSVTSTGFTGDLTGNASTATTLQTSRNINGVAFNGSTNITVADSTKLALTGGTLTGALTINAPSEGTWTKPIAAMVPTLGNGQNAQFTFGKALSNNNLVEYSYHHQTDGSASNYFTMGFYGITNRVAIRTDGRVSIGQSYASPSFTYELNVNGTASATTFIGALTGNASTATSAGSVTNTLTIGTGLSGTSFNGSAAVTVAIDSTVATLTGTQTLTNKTLTSPVLGGTTISAAGNIVFKPSTNILEIQGDGSTVGQIQLNCPVNTHGQKIASQPHAASATNTLTLPGGTTIGNSDAVLVSDTGTQTLTNKTLSAAVLTGTLTAGGGVGTNGQVLQSTVTGVQWATVSGGGAGTTTNALTIGTGLSGTSFNGSAAVTVAIDSTVATLTGSQTLTNKTLTTPIISSISNTGTLTLPTATDTLVGRATTDTLTNKTLSSAVLTGTLTAGGGVGTNGQVLQSTVTGVQWATVSGGAAGTTTNALTIGTGLSGTSFNGSAAVTVAIDSTVATLTGAQTLTNKSLTSPIVTGTLTAGGGVGANGQVLQSTGTGVQWATASGGSGGITTGKAIAMAIVFGG